MFTNLSSNLCNLTEPATEDINLESLFRDRPIKTISVLASIVGGGISIPFVYGIIWFEENNHLRTLINQLVSSICWLVIVWNFVVQLPAVILYLYGPLGVLLCSLDLVVRNALTMQVAIQLNRSYLNPFFRLVLAFLGPKTSTWLFMYPQFFNCKNLSKLTRFTEYVQGHILS
jgi:hypothetical protein